MTYDMYMYTAAGTVQYPVYSNYAYCTVKQYSTFI